MFTIGQGTIGMVLERQRLMNNRLAVVCFAFPDNPNGDYGMWTFEKCVDWDNPVK